MALANYTEIAEGRAGPHGGVYLDISHRGREYIADKLPRMYRQFIEWQMLDISRDPMEVAPTAHYSMGGIVVDPETHATDVRGLYAAGECVGGLHGANRLGGNSLGEALIAGRRAGEAAAAFALEGEAFIRSRRAIGEALDELDGLTRPGSELARPLQRTPPRPDVGAVRRRPRARPICGRPRRARRAPGGRGRRRCSAGRPKDGPTWHRHSTCARASSWRRPPCGVPIERRETRGAQIRSDFPDLDPDLQVNFYVDARLEPWAEPVDEPPPDIVDRADRSVPPSADRLLE